MDDLFDDADEDDLSNIMTTKVPGSVTVVEVAADPEPTQKTVALPFRCALSSPSFVLFCLSMAPAAIEECCVDHAGSVQSHGQWRPTR